MSVRFSRIYVAGHRGMVGSSILRRLKQESKYDIITTNRDELDLLDQSAVFNFFKNTQIDFVVLAAARVGGYIC